MGRNVVGGVLAVGVSILFALQLLGAPAAASSKATSTIGIPNIQASHPVSGGATDETGACVSDAAYNNHRSESWIAIDPTNPMHLVGMSKFFFHPEFYLFHLGAYVSTNGGTSWTNVLIPGFDCQSAPANSWVDTTDPNLAFDSLGNVYSTFLPFSFKYNPAGFQVGNVIPNTGIFAVKSGDGGSTWTIANQGRPIALYNSGLNGLDADKQWIAVDTSSTKFKDNVYAAWTVFDGLIPSELWFSRSTDHGATFSTPMKVSTASNDGPFNTYVFMGTAPDGTLYLSYTSFPHFPMADVWILKSTDGGASFSAPMLAGTFSTFPFLRLPNTTFRDGIADNFAVNPANGHLLLTVEVYNGKGIDVQLTESVDGGATWSKPIYVNDGSTVNDFTDQFQPSVAASPSGTVAVAFYDRRLACPNGDPNILRADQGLSNFCIDTSIQFFSDGPAGLQALGSNTRVTKHTWDPQNPGTTTGQLPHPGGPKSITTFIGDYFGLALTDKNAYPLFVSDYNEGQNPANDQQQFLAIVPLPSG